MRRIGLGAQLGLAFAIVAASTALLIAIGMGLTWQKIFETYVGDRVEANATVFAQLASESFDSVGRWNNDSLLSLVGMAGSLKLRAQVLNAHGFVLADSYYRSGQVPLPGADDELRPALPATNTLAPMSEPVRTADIFVGSVRVGSIRMASASPGSLLTDSDLQFRDASFAGLALAAALAVAFATAGGLLYSRVFARPIERVTRTAAALRAGTREARTGMSGDDPVGVLGRTLDEMAESIQAEREFERRLTADVAHELRTPLQAIQATVEAIQDGVLPAEKLEVVHDETVRLGRLADSILELSRLENRSVQFRMAPVDAAVPLMRAVDSHRALFESLELTLTTDVEEGTCVTADLDRLTQTFGNLLSNAARYTPAGGSVAVRLAADPRDVVISVSDSGIGIPEEQRDRIFTRFWRSEAARERSRSGFGVGLAMVREIVDQHGGSVSFRSNEPEPGTTFEVRLPLVRKRQKV
jgi:two-component system sensor histidine kinase BaeS